MYLALQKRCHGSIFYILLWITFLLFQIVSAKSPSRRDSERFLNSLISPRAAYSRHSPLEFGLLQTEPERDPKCPPCFDCHLKGFPCSHFSNCSDYSGRCECPSGFTGNDCSIPACSSLADGINRKPREPDELCQCSEGWGGINCNVCNDDRACDRMVVTGMNGTCYKGGFIVRENFQMCDVKNRKILDMLPNQPPQVTFSCNRTTENCDFQFWINQTESFYCHLNGCSFDQEITDDKNTTIYKCDTIKCECVIGEMLCGKDGSIDLSEWLVEEIKGPADFKCKNTNECRFSEPAMNELILSVFGDENIMLDCDSGECLHYTEVPGFERPRKPKNTAYIILSVLVVFILVAGIFAVIHSLSQDRRSQDSYGEIVLDDETAKLMANHTPATLLFRNVGYFVGEKEILSSIHGVVKPGQVMAILGGSGAGKTSFLDILARKNKAGIVSGDIYVNGRAVRDEEFKSVVGYVDQEDHLLPTLTVYETILYSALLRLPAEMTIDAKKYRVIETMKELGIIDIRDSKIGDTGTRSISGGEKRRVSIACELVTSPSILFLDEPTSGLDAYNAYNVVESLVTLARDYRRTVICTIHQPRSNIFALFDQLLLLGNGHMIYSGEASRCQSYFESIGHKCPPGFNIADYLVDLTMYAARQHDDTNENQDSNSNGNVSIPGARPQLPTRNSIHEIQDSQLYTPRTSEDNVGSFELNNRRPRENNLPRENSTHDINMGEIGDNMSDHLRMLVESYRRSPIAAGVTSEIDLAINSNEQDELVLTSVQESLILSSHRRASWATQFQILSDRTFKNLYRNPMLMLTHYCISIFLALLCGALFFKVTNDIAGFQNRMGILFFMCALLGFGCLSSLNVFAAERIIFVKERANGYYAPITYFTSKVLFDIIPLRVVPPILMSIIIYHMVGLVPGLSEFFKFLLVLVLFNLTAASICLCIGIIFKEVGVASLLSSLVMLFSMLFGGLLLNKESIPGYLAWLKNLSFFNYAFEAMLVNEVKYLQLTEEKYGLQIDVPGATILSTFGFDASAYWSDVTKLALLFMSFIMLSFACLQLFVKELR
ncbi:ABC transporter [Gigaspora margarita]|uniref:ABC transporter n=2 Tax=Gigaspora margarita TaxID=4874 RepID=A0A8H3X0I3_GIGMA|nr:ABC transporter [Gigaspora margarita]